MTAITALRSMISEIERVNSAAIAGRKVYWPEIKHGIFDAMARLLPDLSMADAHILRRAILTEQEIREFVSDEANNPLNCAEYALNEFVLTGMAGSKRDALARLVGIKEFHEEGAFEPDERDREASRLAVWDMQSANIARVRGETLKEWVARVRDLEPMAEAAE